MGVVGVEGMAARIETVVFGPGVHGNQASSSPLTSEGNGGTASSELRVDNTNIASSSKPFTLGEAIDWDLETSLPKDIPVLIIRSDRQSSSSSTRSINVLTGATGLLGKALLQALEQDE